MTVTCPGCKKRLTVADSAIGKVVVCPACKAKVPVEESLELMPEADAAPADIVPLAPSPVATQGRMCPNCGVPVLPKDLLCRRCGTDLVTGARDKSLAGYQASTFRKMFARTGWILTLLVTAGIGFGIYIGVMKFKDYAGSFKQKDPARSADEQEKAPPTRKGPKRAAAPAPAKRSKSGEEPKPGEEETPGKAAASDGEESTPRTPEEERMVRFTKAVTLLQSGRLRERRMGLQRIKDLGPHAVPLVLEGIEQEENLQVCLLLIGVLAEIPRPEAAGALVDLLADPDDRVRAAAVQGLASCGQGARGAVEGGLGAKSARARVGAVRVAAALQLKDLAPEVMRMLGDKAPEVRQEAARALGGALGSKEAVEPLIARLDDTNMDVAAAASEALAKRPEALARVKAELAVRGTGSEEAQANKLFLLAGPILASADPAATAELAERACAQTPTPKNVERAKSILAARKVITRIEALSKARSERGSRAPMPLIVNLCLADPDVRIKTAGIEYLASYPTPDLPMPLVICLGHSNMEFAMAVADEALRLSGDVARNTLRRAAKGVHIRRKILAAGVLAQRKDETGKEVLALAAGRELNIPSPLPGWAAYCYSFVGEKGRAEPFAAAAAAQKSMLEQALYYAAAARLGHAESRKKLLAMSTDRRIPAIARVKIVGILADFGEGDPKKLLLQVAGTGDTKAQIAAIRALAGVRDPGVVTDLVGLIPQLVPSAAAEAISTILSYGEEAENQLQDALAKDDRRGRLGALAAITKLGPKASKPTKTAVVKLLRESDRDHLMRRHVDETLMSMSDNMGPKDGGWGAWSEHFGIAVEDPAKLPLKRRPWSWYPPTTLVKDGKPIEQALWVSLRVPEAWREKESGVGDPEAPGKPQINVTFEVYVDAYWRHFTEGGQKIPYTSAEQLRNKRRRELAELPVSKGFVPKPGVKAVDGAVFSIAGAKAAPMMLVDEPRKLTTYWLFVFKKDTGKSWVASIGLSAQTKEFSRYRKLFLEKVAKSLEFGYKKETEAERAKATQEAPGGPETWGWVTFTSPVGWLRRREDIFQIGAPGKARVTVTTERDPFDPELKLPKDKRRYASATAMRQERALELTARKMGKKYIPLPSVKYKAPRTFRVGKAKAAPLLVINASSGYTTYWYFIAYVTKEANWYCEIRCMALTQHYRLHSEFFEKGIQKSLKLDFDKMK